MNHKFASRMIAVMIASSMLVGSARVYAEETIRCASHHYHYKYCRVDTDSRVSLVRQHSKTKCQEGRNWGYDSRGVWVDRGCDADFKVRKRHRHKDGETAAIAVGAAAVGVALIAALASSGNHDQDIPAWAVGKFHGHDKFEGADVSLTILPGGSVSGRAGKHEFSGHLSGEHLEAGRHRFRIKQSGNGFLADDEANKGHRVAFRRVASGY